MKLHHHSESIATRQERKLTQAGFPDPQITALVDILADLATKDDISRLEARLDNTATKEEIIHLEARLGARLDSTATKEDLYQLKESLDKKFFQLLLALPFMTFAMLSVTFALGMYFAK